MSVRAAVIQTVAVPREYFSLAEGRRAGVRLGVWTAERDLALRFARDIDGFDYIKAHLNDPDSTLEAKTYSFDEK